MDLVVGLTKTKTLFGKKVKIKGWYRRSPIPYVEIYEMEVGETKKKFHSYVISKIFLMILFVLFVAGSVILFMI